jgi:hypothetical protein
MAAVTLQGTIDKLVALTIPNVKSIRESPPSSVSSAMLPVGYIRNGVIALDQRSLSFQGGLQTVTCELIILVDASRQGTVDELYRRTRQIADDIATVLNANAASLRLDDFTIKEDFEGIETNSYFIVSAIIRCA